MTTIDLTSASDYRRDNYGVLLESVTVHTVAGRGVHNNGMSHRLDVWQNKMRDDYQGQAEAYKDPRGGFTESPYSYLLSAQASVIALRDIERPEHGDSVTLGDIVRLTVHGYSLGWFQIKARPLHDPHLVPVDISTSASRQYYIDSGEYLERDIEA